MLKYSYPVNCVSVYSNNSDRYYGECWSLGIKIDPLLDIGDYTVHEYMY